MARATLLVLMLFISAVVHASASRTLEFSFFDASGNEYHSVSLQKSILKSHGVKSNAHILLVYSPSLKDHSLAEQSGILAEHGAMEELQLLYVVACPSVEDRQGYYVPSSKAHKLSAKPHQFSVALVGDGGRIIKRWYQPVSLKEIRGVLLTTSNQPLQRRAPELAR